MTNKHENSKRKLRFIHFAPFIWFAIVVAAYLTAPNIDQFIREEGAPSAPDGYPSTLVESMVASDGGFGGNEIIIVYHAEERGEFTAEELRTIEETFERMEENQENFPIHDLITPFDHEDAEDRLYSEEEGVLTAVLQVEMDSFEYADNKENIQQMTDPEIEGVSHYQTGELAISEDVIVSSETGLERSTYITVFLVFAVLWIVFKSPFAPIVPLIILASVYGLSIASISFLISTIGFPISQFTQIFVLTVVFGVGTDYCILIMQRFQEEMQKTDDTYIAMKRTMRGARQSVFFSAFTGFIGFAAIGLASFNLYQSAVGVALSMIYVVIALEMLLPFVLHFFGKRLFWPSKIENRRTDSRLWGKLAFLALHRTKFAVLLVLVLTLPLLFMYSNDRSFNNLDEINEDFGSVIGFNLIDEAFGESDLFFSTLLIETEDTWDNAEALPYLEYLSMNLMKIDHVESVRTVTRPTGDQIEEASVPELSRELADGLEETIEGLSELREGQQEMIEELESAEGEIDEAEEGLEDLVDGTEAAIDGLSEGIEGLEEISAGLNESVAGLDQFIAAQPAAAPELEAIQAGFAGAAAGLEETIAGFNEIAEGLTGIQTGQEELLTGMDDVREIADTLIEALEEMEEGSGEIEEGLSDIFTILEEMADQTGSPLAGFVVLDEMLEDEDFEDVWEQFATPGERRVAYLEILFDSNPYSEEAMNILDEVEEVTAFTLKDSMFEDAEIAIEGISSTNRDLRDLSNDDFFLTATVMLLGIYITLVFLFRSLIMPLYVITSLIVTYFCAMSITEIIYVHILGYPGVMWAAPFFGFVLLMALGVDYSIFLLGRLSENFEKQMTLTEVIEDAMKKIGGTVLSAAVILGGTFASLLPSGVLSLMQISTIVIAGLAFYTLVMLPLFVPVMFKLIGRHNWWPFKSRA